MVTIYHVTTLLYYYPGVSSPATLQPFDQVNKHMIIVKCSNCSK